MWVETCLFFSYKLEINILKQKIFKVASIGTVLSVRSIYTKPVKANTIMINDNKYYCSIGRSGVLADKKEGDCGTPLGNFKIRKIYYRPDRINPNTIHTNIQLVPLTKNGIEPTPSTIVISANNAPTVCRSLYS